MAEDTGKTIDVVLADDHPVVRSALRALLEGEPDVQVVAEAGDAEAAVEETRAHGADVLLLDLNMPGMPVLDAIADMSGDKAGPAVVVLTMDTHRPSMRAALDAGATAYVLKQSADRDLVAAVRAAAPGEMYAQSELDTALDAEGSVVDDLTERETEVLGLIARGHTSSDIASILEISVRTVESHRAHIQQKLRLEGRPELVRYALDRGLLTGD